MRPLVVMHTGGSVMSHCWTGLLYRTPVGDRVTKMIWWMPYPAFPIYHANLNLTGGHRGRSD